MDKYVQYHTKEQIAYVQLNRPNVHNAFNEEFIQELHQTFQQIQKEKNNLRAVILSNNGKTFCAGADLHWMRKMKNYTYDQNLKDAQQLAQMIDAIFTCPLPTIAKIQGNAFGGGVGILAACDFTTALENTTFAFSEARLGLAPACIAYAVVQRIGPQKAKQLFLTAQTFSAQYAQQIGLIDHVAKTTDELEQQIQQWLQQLLLNSPNAQEACKQLVYNSLTYPLPQAQEQAAQIIAQLRISPEGQEGLNAFFQKRPPQFRKGNL